MFRKTFVSAAVIAMATAGVTIAQDTNRPGQAGQSQTGQTQTGQGQMGQGQTGQGQMGQGQMGQGQTGQGQMGQRQGMQSQQLTQQEQQQLGEELVEFLHQVNLFEIQAAQLIQQKLQDRPQVAQMTRQIIQDHQRLDQQVKQVAQQMNVSLSDDLDEVHQAKLAKMREKDGTMLYNGFVFGQVAGHQMSILSTAYAARYAQDPQVKQLAAQALPALQSHLQMAQREAAEILGSSAEAQPAGARMGGDSSSYNSGSTTGNQSGNVGSTRGGTSNSNAGGVSGGGTPGSSIDQTDRDRSNTGNRNQGGTNSNTQSQDQMNR